MGNFKETIMGRRGQKRQKVLWTGGLVLLCALLLIVTCGYALGAEKAFTFSQEFRLQLPSEWVQVPPEVFENRMKEMAKSLKIENAQKELGYDYALQLRSKDWFAYPYILISLWDGVRVDSDEIQDMNTQVQKSLQKKHKGISGNELLSAEYFPSKHMYRAKGRFSMAGTEMVLIKSIWYLNQDVLILSAYLPRAMSSEYASDIAKAMNSLELAQKNIYRPEDDQGTSLAEAVLPYTKVIIATAIVLLLIGIYLWRKER